MELSQTIFSVMFRVFPWFNLISKQLVWRMVNLYTSLCEPSVHGFHPFFMMAADDPVFFFFFHPSCLSSFLCIS